jgi:hypothetical protein
MPSGDLVENLEEPVTYLQELIIFECFIIHFCKYIHNKVDQDSCQVTGAFSLTGKGIQRSVNLKENFVETVAGQPGTVL